MAAQAGLCLAWSETPEDTFCHDEDYMDRVKRIWYLSHMRAAKVQTSLHEPSDRKPDPWPLRMAGHAQLKFVMTECSKTQIRLTGLICFGPLGSISSFWVVS